jgi:RHS repeat-associated protein
VGPPNAPANLQINDANGIPQFAFGYDARGNVSNKGLQGYQFDAANRLSAVTGLQSYRYDGQGRRVQTTDADGKVERWIYSQAGQVLYTSEERRSQNIDYLYLGNTQVATRNWAFGSGTVTVKYEHTDALGSPVIETDASANILSRKHYAPYGEAWNSVIDGTGYTGHVMDQAAGLTYMQQRYYDPQIGGFLSVDPANSGFNRYDYAADNPYRFTDPDGRCAGAASAHGGSTDGHASGGEPPNCPGSEVDKPAPLIATIPGTDLDKSAPLIATITVTAPRGPDPNMTDRPEPQDHPGPWRTGYVFSTKMSKPIDYSGGVNIKFSTVVFIATLAFPELGVVKGAGLLSDFLSVLTGDVLGPAVGRAVTYGTDKGLAKIITKSATRAATAERAGAVAGEITSYETQQNEDQK